MILFGFWAVFLGPRPPKSVLASKRERDFHKSHMFDFRCIWDAKVLPNPSTKQKMLIARLFETWSDFLNAFCMDSGSHADPKIWSCGVLLASIFCRGSHFGHRRVPSLLRTSLFNAFCCFWTHLAPEFQIVGCLFLCFWDGSAC